MSRWLESDGAGGLREVLASTEECRYLIDGTCCNEKSEQCRDWPHPEYCALRCPHFTPEDAKLVDSYLHST